MENNQLITIVLTTYNRAHLIGEMLDSIKAQTYIKWECIIIDDNSTDNVEEVVNDFLVIDSRFLFLKKPKDLLKGLPSSRNIGIKKAQGNYIIFFDDDDVLHPELLHRCLAEFKRDRNIDFVHYKKQAFQGEFDKNLLSLPINHDILYFNENLFEKVILGEFALASCTVLWKSKLLKTNHFNESLMYAEEWECYSRILINNKLSGVFIKSPLYFNRKHNNSNTGEFWNNDPIRMDSYIKAQQIVCESIVDADLMTKKLKKYFYHKTYTLKSKMIISKFLEQSFMNKVYLWIYPLKYNLYKFLKQF